MANGLACLQIDLIDPEFHAITLAQYTAIRNETKKLLDDAVAAEELKPCDTAALTRLIQQVNGGAMLDWAVISRLALRPTRLSCFTWAGAAACSIHASRCAKHSRLAHL